MKLPKDLDATMWDIVKRGDKEAAEAFAKRFPALAEELASRMQAIQGLKGFAAAVTPTIVPPLKLRFSYRPASAFRRYAPAAAGFAALAAASFYIVSNIVTPLPDIKFPVAEPRSHPPVTSSPARPAPPPTSQTDVDNGPMPFQQDGNWLERAPAVPPMGRAVFDGVPLLSALQAIAEKGSIELIVPDKFPNPTVSVDISGRDATDMIQQLGSKYGFTAFPQQKGQILLIPAVDSGPAPQE